MSVIKLDRIEATVFTERCDTDNSGLATENMVNITTSRCDMDDPCSFACNNVRIAFEVAAAVDDSVAGDSRSFRDSGEVIDKRSIQPVTARLDVSNVNWSGTVDQEQ